MSLGAAAALCPCGKLDCASVPWRPLAYAQCCGRYLDDFAAAPALDAESLMRSRYAAFVLERADYLLATWHGSTRPPGVEFDPDVKWLGWKFGNTACWTPRTPRSNSSRGTKARAALLCDCMSAAASCAKAAAGCMWLATSYKNRFKPNRYGRKKLLK